LVAAIAGDNVREKMARVETDVRTLCDRAVELGARAARPLPAHEVVVDPRVALKCRVPLCASYGRNLMCPPFVPTADEFASTLRRYASALVVQQLIPLTAADVERRYRGKGLDELVESKAYQRTLAASQNRFDAVMGTLEREALGMGYAFAAAFGGGDCCLCEACVAAQTGIATCEPCRHPFLARPSMEAVGVDVLATAAAAGLPIEMPATDDPVWTGLLLVH
jgi:predicted metal-binding protein